MSRISRFNLLLLVIGVAAISSASVLIREADAPPLVVAACRMAIARALVEYSADPALKARMIERDRFMIAEDFRRVEPKKYLGPKARARFQKSYR